MSFRCVGLGEVLWDLLPAGRELGGAPANFAYHARALGARAAVISRVGADAAGRELVARLADLGVGAEAVATDPSAPTGTVSVGFEAGGQPRYQIHENVAWDFLAADDRSRCAAASADALCFGTLAQRSTTARLAIRTLVGLTRPGALRIFDVNLRQHYYDRELIAESLALANVLKINESELPRLAEMFSLGGDEPAQVAALVERFGLRAVAYTRGERGSLVHADGAWVDLPGQKIVVADTVGAGDSFTAAFAIGLLKRWPLDVIAARAAAVSAYVCTQRGATPPLPGSVSSPFLN